MGLRKRKALDFVCIGAARAGTTWLAHVLRNHPNVFIPTKKELHYFNNDQLYTEDLSGFFRFFQKAKNNELKGEITPRYIINNNALSRIKKHFPTIKIIIILRDPVERSFSQFQYFRFNKNKEYLANFGTALEGPYFEDYITKSRYGECLERVYKYFERSQVKIIDFRDIEDDPHQVLVDVENFLGLKHSKLTVDLNKKINKSKTNFKTTPLNDAVNFYLQFGKGSVNQIFFKVLRKLFSIISIYTISLETVLRRVLGLGHSSQILSPDIKKEIYKKYFKNDVRLLERLTNKDYSHWSS